MKKKILIGIPLVVGIYALGSFIFFVIYGVVRNVWFPQLPDPEPLFQRGIIFGF